MFNYKIFALCLKIQNLQICKETETVQGNVTMCRMSEVRETKSTTGEQHSVGLVS